MGAIATQSWIKASYGAQGLRLLADGASASEVLDRLVAEDDGREQRQVGVVDRQGRTASYTGAACLEWAGERRGPSYASQGNMLVSGDALAALAETFEATASEPLGYQGGELAAELETWAGVENLENRVEGADRIDPVVLGELRKRWRGVEGT